MQRILLVLVLITASFAAACGATVNDRTKNGPRAPSPLKDPALLTEQGDAFAADGDFTRAQQYFAAALAAGAPSRQVLQRLLKACIASGDLRLASEYAETELSRRPDDPHLRFVTGALHAHIGNRVEARNLFVQAATELTGDPSVQFSVGAFFRDDMADKVAADPYFRAYLALAPNGEHVAEAKASLMERVQ